jgi:tripartite-type tricarboxylate transporter receptor subunit TctC
MKLAALLGIVFVGTLLTEGRAQDYPTKPIRVIVATSAGGTSDIFMRALGEEFQKRTGQPLIVENRSGGGMNIGGKACADAPKDGYTICILPNETLTLNQFLYKKLNYNPETDFEPITNPFFNTQVVVASAALGVKSLEDLAALSKSKPGTLSYTALAIPLQMFIEEWKKKTGADLVAVPGRGGGDVVTGVLGGSVPVAIVGIPNWLPQIRSGTVVPLAVNSQERSPLLPDVPTLAELGFPQEVQMYFGIVAPAGTPKAYVEKLFAEFRAIGEDPQFRQQRMIEQGLIPVFNAPKDFEAYLAAERLSMRKRFAESGMEQR